MTSSNNGKQGLGASQSQEKLEVFGEKDIITILPETFIEPTDEEERRLVRKQDLVLMPMMMLIYLFFDLDGITLGKQINYYYCYCFDYYLDL